MIDLDNPVDLPGLAVCVWADTDDLGQVWACADGPRWAVDADGAPAASLLVYRRGAGGPVEGGMVTLTLDLALTAQELEAVLTAAAERREAGSAGQGAPRAGAREPPLPPICSPPQWSAGSIQVELVDGLASSTDASAMGDNRATFAIPLDATTGPQVAAAWAAGLPDARATAELQVRTAAHGEAGSTASTVGPGLRSRMAVSVAMSRAVDAPVRLSSELQLPSGVRTASTTEITL